MSISSTTNRNDYTGTGSLDTYSFTFKITDENHLKVTERNLNGVESTLLINIDYSVSGVNSASGGTIVLLNGDLTADHHLTIRRVEILKQETDIRNSGDFYPEVHEDAFDHFIAIDQQQQDEISRSIKLPETVSSNIFNPVLPAEIAGSISKVLGTNESGNGFVVGPTFDEISNAQGYATAAGVSAAAALVSEGNAATSETNAAASAVASAASAVDSATSALYASQMFDMIVGSSLGCNYPDLGLAIFAATAGQRILVKDGETINSGGGFVLSVPNVLIEFAHGVTFTKGTLTGSLFTIDENGCRIKGGRFAGFDTVVTINSSKQHNFITECRFSSCTNEVIESDSAPNNFIGMNITE